MAHLYAFSVVHLKFMLGSCCCTKLNLDCVPASQPLGIILFVLMMIHSIWLLKFLDTG
jgi:hypothetical protein